MESLADSKATVSHSMMGPLYAPLDPAQSQIRLLTIKPGHGTSRVQCALLKANLQGVSFDALSYCWGRTQDPIAIEVDGQELMVPSNLAAALNHFRSIGVGVTTAIWIDAVCINQTDDAERSSQVARMGTLYKQAATVHIWLGGPSTVSQNGMLALEDLATFTLRHRSISGIDYWPDREDENGARKLRDLYLLSANVYWTRTWIVQEIAFAMSCVVHGNDRAVRLQGQEGDYSSKSFPFYEVLQRMTIQPRGHSFETAETIQLCKKIKDAFYHIETTGFVAKIRDHADEPSYVRLMTETFLRYRPLLATDPRDKVYGMLGLLPSRLLVTPDYNKSVKQVYVELTAEIIRSSNDLQIVNDACSGSADLPTWVPDLRVPCRFPPYFVQKLITYRASAGVPASFRVEENGLLITHGLCIDTVANVERGIDSIGSIHDLQKTLQQWRALFDKGAASTIQLFSETQLNNAFWNAITRPVEDAELFDEEDAQLCSRLMSTENAMSSLDAGSSALVLVEILKEAVSTYDMFLTATGHLGHAPKGYVELDDCLIVLAGAPSPFCAMPQDFSVPETYALRAPCTLMPFDTNPDGGEFDGTNPIMDGSWLLAQAKLESLLDVHEEHGKKSVLDVLHEMVIC